MDAQAADRLGCDSDALILSLIFLPYLSADEGEDTLARALKRPRLVWTPKLHARFVEAVEQLGLKVAVPKTIMQVGAISLSMAAQSKTGTLSSIHECRVTGMQDPARAQICAHSCLIRGLFCIPARLGFAHLI